MTGFLTRLFGKNNDNKSKQDPLEGSGVIIKRVIAAKGDDVALKQIVGSLFSLEGTIPQGSKALKDLLSHNINLYSQIQNNGVTHLAFGTQYRVSAWVHGEGRDQDNTEIVILEEKDGAGNWRLADIKSSGNGPMTYVMVLELPCCKGEDSVLVYFKKKDGFAWKLIQSEEALVAGMLDDITRRNVQIGHIAPDGDRGMFDEIMKHLKGAPHNCTSSDKFTSQYREPQ